MSSLPPVRGEPVFRGGERPQITESHLRGATAGHVYPQTHPGAADTMTSFLVNLLVRYPPHSGRHQPLL